jgi:hypothetical protein
VIIEHPIVVTSNVPPHRPLPGVRPGGGNTAVVSETLRPLDDPWEGAASRRSERHDMVERRPVRDDAEWAARMRVDVAREQARQSGEPWVGAYRQYGDGAVDRDTYISAAEIRRLRDRLEARIAREPGILTLHSVDVRI